MASLDAAQRSGYVANPRDGDKAGGRADSEQQQTLIVVRTPPRCCHYLPRLSQRLTVVVQDTLATFSFVLEVPF